jgi:hypothetical protein
MIKAQWLIEAVAARLTGAKFRGQKSWLDVTADFNLRVLPGWRQYPGSDYLALFKGDGGADYIFELDTSLISEAGGRIRWSLNNPNNPTTRVAVASALGALRDRSDAYRAAVRGMREQRGQPNGVRRQGYLIADGLPREPVVDKLVSLLAAVANAHGASWIATPAVAPTTVSLRSVEETFDEGLKKAAKDSPQERQRRLLTAQRVPEVVTVLTTVFRRNPDVVIEVLRRANGICEDCGKSAPFRRRQNGLPYLEVHHRKRLADGGEDSVENALGVCPNCHRRAHFG